MYQEEIEAAIAKYKDCPLFELKAYRAMAKRYPSGEKSFWIEKRFKQIEKIKNGSFMGMRWVNDDCLDLLNLPNYIEVIDYNIYESYHSKYFDHLDQSGKRKAAIKDIDHFIKHWLEYRAIDAIITDLQVDNESNPNLDDDSNIKKFDFKPLLSLLKRPYNDEQKMKFEKCFNDLLVTDMFINSSDQCFAAFASIVFDTGYFKKPWTKYLETFSSCFERSIKSKNWKQSHNQVIDEVKSLKNNPLLPFLREIPRRDKSIF
nr:hypothetical protein [uncultured Draconibacterium sp.]